jgi:butyryl-CoA dehydrogenase
MPGRIGIGALSLGIAEGAYEEAVKYASERKQFGKAISEFQGLQFMLADMATEIEGGQAPGLQRGLAQGAGKPYSKEASMAKLFASEVAMRVTTKAVQVHGGYGYTRNTRWSA